MTGIGIEGRVSASMAEGIRKAMRDHQVSWKADLADEVFVAHCTSCGYLGSELETFEHQANIAAEVLAANGYGKLENAKAEALREKFPKKYGQPGAYNWFGDEA